MDNVTIRLLVTISRFHHPRGIERKQSLTSIPQARASCAQAVGRAGAGPGLRGRADPPLRARGGGQADAAP